MDALTRLTESGAIARLVERDPTLFTDDVDLRQPIMQRLGWTDLAEKASARLPLVANLASQLAEEGVTDVVLLGMGGSSLAPLVIDAVLGSPADSPALHVLDTTSPDVLVPLMERLSPATAAFVLASKSGSTIEPLSLYAILRGWMDDALGRVAAGKRFVVVTDPGSPLERLRQKDVMRIAVSAPANVGGRFSALSVFGLTPTGIAGVDLAPMIEDAARMEQACRHPAEDNPAAALAAWMADNHAAGRDKLTFVASPRYATFGLWVEQLVAESTGKQGVGILPVLEDGRVPASTYGADRTLLVLREPSDAACASHADAARAAGVPVMEHVLDGPAGLGGEFVRWEYAVALTGFLLGVNPFDEPNVAEAKEATTGVLEQTLPIPAACCDLGGVWPTFAGALEDTAPPRDLAGALHPLLGGLAAGRDYLALLVYLPEGPALDALRAASADASTALGVPVCVETGPRYLHSTGQLHKGGPATGSFLIVTVRSRTDIAIPERGFSLGQLYRAQAEGDLVTLASRRRPVLRLDLPDSGEAVELLAREIASFSRQRA